MDELKPCPYTDEEVSQKLRKWKGHCQIPGLDELILWAADIIDRRPAPENNPLTLEQRRQMDAAGEYRQVVYARWIKRECETELLAVCSECSYPVSWWHKTPHCPACGALMDGKGDSRG